MATLGAFLRLLPPSAAFFAGLFFLSERAFESRMVGVVVCSIALPCLTIVTIRAAKLLRVEPPPSAGGFPVVPLRPDAPVAAG